LHTMLISGAAAGLGIALVPRFFVDAQFARLGLIVPFDAPAIAEAAYYLVYPTELSHGRPLASFREWLLEQAAAYGAANPVLASEADED
jgi:LysR family glycine cleavage system transcriptional activator